MIEKMNSAVWMLLQSLADAGFEAYIVGGSVRDYLLNKQLADIDITTNATPEQMMSIFPKAISINNEHGTVLVRQKNIIAEVTTFRKRCSDQNYTLTFGETLKEDVSYRDFTMNALAMDRNGVIIDYYDGQSDLANRTIRAVNNPHERFKEDPLRMLRAVRFVSELNFTIEKKTLLAIEQLNDRIEHVATERIKEELSRLITGQCAPKAIELLLKTKLIHYMPIFKYEASFVHYLAKHRRRFISFAHFIAYMYYQNNSISISRWVKAWKCSNKEKQDSIILFEAIERYGRQGMSNWLIYHLPERLDKSFVHLIDTLYNKLLDVNELQQFRNKLPIQSRTELEINGNNLLQYFPNQQPGAWIEQMLTTIEREVVMNRLPNNEQRIKEWILCHPHETN